MKVFSLLEFDKFPQEQIPLPILFVLMSFREYLKTVPQTNGRGPRFALILEEAHVVAVPNSNASPSPDIADPASAVSAYICNMLAELRALGVMIVIVDQFPSGVAPEVIKSTTSKLAFNQVARADREELASAMLLGPTEREDLARLKTGEAFFFTEGYHRPRRLSTTNLHDQFDLDHSPPNGSILPYMEHDDWFRQAASERVLCELTQLRERMDSFDEGRLKLVNKFASLLALHHRIVTRRESPVRPGRLQDLKREAQQLHRRITSAYRQFLRNSYKRYLPSTECAGEEPLIQEMRTDLISRFESVIEPDITKSLAMIDRFISRFQADER